VVAGNIPERAVAIANEIAQDEPTLVGLQEASQWLTGPLRSPPATTVVYDQLQSLLAALAQQGLHYTPIGISKNIDVEAPSNLGVDVRFIDRDVLLARTDLANVTYSNIQIQHFAHLLTVNTIVGAVTIPRGWISVDVTIKGSPTFRFLTTHLESFSSAVQVAQGNELVQGPANTSLPVVLSGDFNSNAGSNTGSGLNQTPTYGNLIAAGFFDAWSAKNPNDPGYTWPLHLEDPLITSATPVDRIDLVLLLNKISAIDAQLVGNDPGDLTDSGLWPSDHAGVVATVRI
jgi:endonuclease/exonuclease/phosphatase family metal-dependent hydrolase